MSSSLTTGSQDHIVHLLKMVATLDRPKKFKYLCDLLAHALELDENIIEITAKTWELLESEQLWKEAYATFEQFKEAIAFSEVVEPILICKTRCTQDRRLYYAQKIHNQWTKSAEESLGAILPTHVGYTTWVTLHRLSCLKDSLTANKLLTLQIQERIASNTGGARAKSPTLLVVDMQAIIISLNQTIYTSIEPEKAHAVGNNNKHIPQLPN